MNFRLTNIKVGKAKQNKVGWLKQSYDATIVLEIQGEIEITPEAIMELQDSWAKKDKLDAYTESKMENKAGNLVWKSASGPKGPYEICIDSENLKFIALKKDLKDHNGRLVRDDHVFWLFDKSDSIGRKRL